MIGLIRKDLYYLRTSWKPLLLSIIIMGGFATAKGFGAILMILLPTFFGLSILGCIQQDAQNKWYTYHKVLPLSIQHIVSSRYLSFLSFVVIALVLNCFYGYGVVSINGIQALGKNFALWEGFAMGVAMALGFASVFLPATYYYKGEKMELSMMMSGFVSFGLVYLASKVIHLLGIQLMDYADIFIFILLIVSIVTFLLSWLLSMIIYQRKSIA